MIPPIYVGIAGQKQNGKDTVADYVQDQLAQDDEFVFKFERAAFAANVKRVFVETFDVTYEFIEKWKTIPEPPPGFDMSVREGLQFIGDGFRKIKSSICPHFGGEIIFDRKLDKLKCLWHDWKFCAQSGKCLSFPIKGQLNPYDFVVDPKPLKNYKIENKENKIYAIKK